MSFPNDYIAVDWGTTNRRAYRITGGERVADFEDDEGVTAVAADQFAAAVAEIRARLGDVPVLMAGMIGSDRGWREAAYVPCPATPQALAESILWVEPGRTGIIPGVRQDGAAGADVMRGEEVQVFGAAAAGQLHADALICHPGTHAKWIVLTGGAIAVFRTMMTGEMFGLLSRHSILSPQLTGSACPEDAFIAGVDEAFAGAELLSALFRIRAGERLNQAVCDPTSYASGLLIGCDVREGLAPAGSHGNQVTLIGRPALTALYAAAINRAGVTTRSIDGAAAFVAGVRLLVDRL